MELDTNWLTCDGLQHASGDACKIARAGVENSQNSVHLVQWRNGGVFGLLGIPFRFNLLFSPLKEIAPALYRREKEFWTARKRFGQQRQVAIAMLNQDGSFLVCCL